MVDAHDVEAMPILAGAFGRESMARLRDTDREVEFASLHRISDELAEFARTLARLAESEQKGKVSEKPVSFRPAPRDGFQEFPDSSLFTDHMAGPPNLREIIKLRRLRDSFFQPDLFADPAWDILLDLKAAMLEIAQKLAQAIVRDGEGATKFITVKVEQASSEEEALKVAYAIGHSPLVKTAFFASDPNLGRILAAVGYAGIDDLDQTKIQLYLGDVYVAQNGGRHPDYREEQGQAVMNDAEITVRVQLGRGNASTTVWTTDFSHEYVTINADYRS